MRKIIWSRKSKRKGIRRGMIGRAKVESEKDNGEIE
jgi:hypothetical protein